MLRAQQVEDVFYGVEGTERCFDEYGVPVCHGAVPQTRQFERLERLALM